MLEGFIKGFTDNYTTNMWFPALFLIVGIIIHFALIYSLVSPLFDAVKVEDWPKAQTCLLGLILYVIVLKGGA